MQMLSQNQKLHQKKQRMRSLSEFSRYDMTGVKLRSDTSALINDRAYYIVKQFASGKASKLYAAFDFKTGITCAWNQDKEELIKWLEDNSELIENIFEEIDDGSV